MIRIVRSLVIFLVLMIVVVSGLVAYLSANQSRVLNENFETIAYNTLEDGEYEGSYKGTRWENTVRVAIEDGQIITITPLDDQRFANPEVRTLLFSRVIDENSIDVDSVSGATVTSIAYLKAIEDALLKAEDK